MWAGRSEYMEEDPCWIEATELPSFSLPVPNYLDKKIFGNLFLVHF